MGILLPPVSQVTTATTLTMHHRNRSLDSALQRIPEVDITPSPECEPPEGRLPKVASEIVPTATPKQGRDREEITSLGSDDSGILCGGGSSDTTRESSVHSINRSHESLESGQDHPTIDDIPCEPLPGTPILSTPVTLCCGGVGSSSASAADTKKSMKDVPQSKGAKDCLLRLFECKLFDMSMAITYLFNSKEPGVQSYIGMYAFL